MSRHFLDDEHVLREVDQSYLDGLRVGAHPDSRNGILYEIASAFLRHFNSTGPVEHEALERHCEELEKRNAELEAALPRLRALVPPAPRNCDLCGKPLIGGLVLIPGKGGGPESFASVHGACLAAFVEAQDKDSEPDRD